MRKKGAVLMRVIAIGSCERRAAAASRQVALAAAKFARLWISTLLLLVRWCPPHWAKGPLVSPLRRSLPLCRY